MSYPGAAEKGASASPSDSPPTGLRWTRSYRIVRRTDFQRIYERGRRSVGASFVVFGEPNDLAHPRLGITATRKLGGAVIRNRIKRVVREIFRRHRPSLAPALDVVVNVRRGAAERAFQVLEREFLDQYRALARQARR